MNKKKLLIIELNEFNEDLLLQGAKTYNLKNINKFLNFKNSKTTSLDEIEHHGLDPWVQWVSVHTGVPYEIHKIKHLADISKLNFPQIWEKIGDLGLSSGIWGAMNASLNKTKGCCFFLPDPWTFSEKAVPKKLNNFLALPRFYAKNYLSISFRKLFLSSLKLIYFIFFQSSVSNLFKDLLYSLKCFYQIGLNSNLIFSIFDLISARVFIKYKNKYDPNLSIIFFNCLAHAQHKLWAKDYLNKNISVTLKVVDRILGIIFNELTKEDALIIINGMSQKNVDGTKYCIYRQLDPDKFINLLDIKYDHLEQCMTNESHIFYNSISEKEKAFLYLKEATINGEKLFHVEKYKEESKKLFVQLDYFKPIKKGTEFTLKGNKYDFYNYFSLLAERTGSHIPYGKAYYKNIDIKNNIYNHEIFNEVLNYFIHDSNFDKTTTS